MVNKTKTNLTRCAVTGSFDPITNGHYDIIMNALSTFDLVYVVVLINESKTSFFTMEERVQILKELFCDKANIIVDSYEGLTIDYCRAHGINVILRGFRDSRDFEYESLMSKYNFENGAVKTLLIPAKEENGFVSSSKVRIALEENKDLSAYLPKKIINKVKEIYYTKVERINESS